MGWSKGLAEWVEGEIAFLSVAFSWKLPEAFQRVIWFRSQGYRVVVGGPGLTGYPDYFAGIAETVGTVDALVHHNPDATRASQGCPVGCYFCIVPKTEGKQFIFLPEFTPRPILCDNNLSALPVEYQNYIIERYRGAGVELLDANSGFEPKTFDEDTYHRWKAIYRGRWRFGYDETREGDAVFGMTQILKDEQAQNKRVYVLIGNEPFQECYERIIKVIEWGCEPYAQPMIAINALSRRPVVKFDWTEQKLNDLARWTNRWNWRTFPFSEYQRKGKAL